MGSGKSIDITPDMEDVNASLKVRYFIIDNIVWAASFDTVVCMVSAMMFADKNEEDTIIEVQKIIKKMASLPQPKMALYIVEDLGNQRAHVIEIAGYLEEKLVNEAEPFPVFHQCKVCNQVMVTRQVAEDSKHLRRWQDIVCMGYK
jgi:hypothetical protein